MKQIKDTGYTVIFGVQASDRAARYAEELAEGSKEPGEYLARQLADRNGLDVMSLVEMLLRTKPPQIFAESAVAGDGRDWNSEELSILGDISIATEVLVYDDGQHRNPTRHEKPFAATLVFTCGALLRNGFGIPTPDHDEVAAKGQIDQAAFTELYRRRLVPVFRYIQAQADSRKRFAVVTVPGLGCGQFAGAFRGQLGGKLQFALEDILESEARRLDRIRLVFFDPYDECEDASLRFESTTFRVRPLIRSQNSHPQLCAPSVYVEGEGELEECDLFSLVAWDQVSWPGNDFYIGSRATDDGVKAAATSSMAAITGFEGRYDVKRAMYLPPEGYQTWLDVVRKRGLQLKLVEPFVQG